MDINTNYYNMQKRMADQQTRSKDKTTTDAFGNVINAVYENPNDKMVSVDNFLQLMIAQLKNQDFMNPTDDTQYVTQLAQFATMQQMTEMAYYATSSYAMSLVGKDVTIASMSIGGKVDKITGPVEKVMLVDKEFKIYVKGKAYDLNQIMEVNAPGTTSSGGVDTSKLLPYPTKIESDSITIEWKPVSSDEDVNKDYTYTVYYSTEQSFDDLDEVKKGTVAGTVGSDGELSIDIKNLKADTTYFINVVATDKSGKQSVYQKATVRTAKISGQ